MMAPSSPAPAAARKEDAYGEALPNPTMVATVTKGEAMTHDERDDKFEDEEKLVDQDEIEGFDDADDDKDETGGLKAVYKGDVKDDGARKSSVPLAWEDEPIRVFGTERNAPDSVAMAAENLVGPSRHKRRRLLTIGDNIDSRTSSNIDPVSSSEGASALVSTNPSVARTGKGSNEKPRHNREDESLLPGCIKPGPNDVLCGRGGGTNTHSGNVRFRELVSEHKSRYLAATKVNKPKVAREVVAIWRATPDPPGRFLARTGESRKNGSVSRETKDNGKTTENEKASAIWHDIGDKKARIKCSQCLRERSPEVMPLVEKLQAQRPIASFIEIQSKPQSEAQRWIQLAKQAVTIEARAVACFKLLEEWGKTKDNISHSYTAVNVAWAVACIRQWEDLGKR